MGNDPSKDVLSFTRTIQKKEIYKKMILFEIEYLIWNVKMTI